MHKLHFESALTPDGWQEDLVVEVTGDGWIATVEQGALADHAERIRGAVIPGMPNLHSHAFQRAMAGLTERAAGGRDNFWSWREVMYTFVERFTPEEVEAIAAQVFVELLKAGYTSVGEFHYLHHGRAGRPYPDRAAMSQAILSAAQRVGLGITHLPTLYQDGGFGGAAAKTGQARFLNGVDDLLGLVGDLRRRYARDPHVRFGLGLHSLRAVSPVALERAVASARSTDASLPIHLHIAEQRHEVEDCLAWSGQRPIAWLLEHADVDAHWCLVHGGELEPTEVTALAASGSVVGLCPTTEANLGDGFFSLPAYLAAGGAIGIGSDSQVSASPFAELRMLEYGQRLIAERRNVASSAADRHVGESLWCAAVAGGAQALGRKTGAIAPGHVADLVVLDTEHPRLLGRARATWLDSAVFAADEPPVSAVMVAGRWRIEDRHHADEEDILSTFRTVIEGAG